MKKVQTYIALLLVTVIITATATSCLAPANYANAIEATDLMEKISSKNVDKKDANICGRK